MKGDLQEWQKGFNVTIVDELISYGNQIFRPCFDYYHKQFPDPDGDLCRLRNSAIAAQIFDPFVLREASIKRLRVLAD